MLPWSSLRRRRCHRADDRREVAKYVDPDAVRVVLGDGKINRALLELRFDHTFFTGSTTVGKAVMEASARHLTPVTLELVARARSS